MDTLIDFFTLRPTFTFVGLENCLVHLFVAHDRPTLHFLCRGLPALVAAKHQLDKLVAKFHSDYSWHSGAGRPGAAFD